MKFSFVCCSLGIEQIAPVDLGMSEWQRVAVDLRNDGVFTGVLSRMAATAGDAAAEKQLAFGTVENDVAGRYGTESFGFCALLIQRHMNAWDGFRNPAQRRMGPIIRNSFGPDEQHVYTNGVLTLAQQAV